MGRKPKKVRKTGTGGAREGAGRPTRYGEPMILLFKMIPISLKEELDKYIINRLERFQTERTDLSPII